MKVHSLILKIIDSTPIRLFSDILRGVGRNTKDGSRKKGGIKVHTLMDAFSGVAEFVRMTEAKVHDRQVAQNYFQSRRWKRYVFTTNNITLPASTNSPDL